MDPTKAPPETFSASLERAMSRIKGGALDLVQSSALAGGLTLAALLGLPGCGEPAMEAEEDPNDPSLGEGKFDWAQNQGRRDTNMVSYLRSYWHEYTNYQGRFGYQGVDVIVKLRVRPVAGADLAKKRVGVEYRVAGFPSRTAVAKYFSTGGDGLEEWHVRVPLRTADPHAFVFNAWYQDGKGNTFYDDNNGEFYPIAYDGAYSVVRQDWGETRVQVGSAGIKGKISVVVADLDYDKDIRIRYSTDGWKTSKELRQGNPGSKNALYWVGKLGTGMERFSADLDLPGAVTQLDYAIVYRHGVVGGATSFEFWDNNGGLNYVVKGM